MQCKQDGLGLKPWMQCLVVEIVKSARGREDIKNIIITAMTAAETGTRLPMEATKPRAGRSVFPLRQ